MVNTVLRCLGPISWGRGEGGERLNYRCDIVAKEFLWTISCHSLFCRAVSSYICEIYEVEDLNFKTRYCASVASASLQPRIQKETYWNLKERTKFSDFFFFPQIGDNPAFVKIWPDQLTFKQQTEMLQYISGCHKFYNNANFKTFFTEGLLRLWPCYVPNMADSKILKTFQMEQAQPNSLFVELWV